MIPIHPRVARKSGFTLIELLIVITVIVVLMALMLPAVQQVRYRAAVLKTTQRMEQVQTALQTVGAERGSTAYVLQRDAGLGGTATFELDRTTNTPRPLGGGPWHVAYPAAASTSPGNPVVAGTSDLPVWAYPWGEERKYFLRENWYASPLGLPATNPDDPSMTAAARDAWYAAWRTPERHSLIELSPTRTIELLLKAGILIGTDVASAGQRMADRSTNAAWNDAWGQPMVVAAAVFQPPRCAIAGSGEDRWLQESLTGYQHNRAIYLAVASAGPALDPVRFPTGLPIVSTPANPSNWATTFDGIWEQACTTAEAAYGRPWDETSFERPVWKGVGVADHTNATPDKTRLRPLISAPISLR